MVKMVEIALPLAWAWIAPNKRVDIFILFFTLNLL